MRKNLLLILAFLLQIVSITVKAQKVCGTTFNPQVIQLSDPERYNRYLQLEQFTANYKKTLKNGPAIDGRLINPNSTIIIPVVVHVLHNGEVVGVGNNISDAQVQSQIDVLNEDFRRLNADRINTPAAFAGVAADPNIEFRLACIDPNGNVTNGIHRVQTGVTAFTFQTINGKPDEQAIGIKFAAQGGTNAWPTDRFLNIWVCNIAPFGDGSQLTGYAQFPSDFTTKPNTDGVVVLNRAFGRVGNVIFPVDEGRTATHEVGHWLNLFHIWGDATCGNDQCDDTPQQLDANRSNCPLFPHFSNCPNNGPNGDMFMNYMDYTVDACQNIFTQDQTDRMRAVFAQGGPRASFIDNYFRLNDPVTTVVCTNTTITAVNPMCLPITWGVTGPATIASQGANAALVTRTGEGSVTITATAGGYTDSKTIWVGLPIVDFTLQKLDPEQQFCTFSFGNTVIIDPTPIFGVTNFQWGYSSAPNNIPPTVLQDPGDYDYDYNFTRGGQYQLYARARNSCGLGSTRTMNVTVSTMCFGLEFSMSPNPSQSQVTISTTKKGMITPNTRSRSLIYKIKIADATGVTRTSYDYPAGIRSTTVSVAGLRSGIYLVSVFDGKNWVSQQLVIHK
jgi:hypothetical protein